MALLCPKCKSELYEYRKPIEGSLGKDDYYVIGWCCDKCKICLKNIL